MYGLEKSRQDFMRSRGVLSAKLAAAASAAGGGVARAQAALGVVWGTSIAGKAPHPHFLPPYPVLQASEAERPCVLKAGLALRRSCDVRLEVKNWPGLLVIPEEIALALVVERQEQERSAALPV